MENLLFQQLLRRLVLIEVPSKQALKPLGQRDLRLIAEHGAGARNVSDEPRDIAGPGPIVLDCGVGTACLYRDTSGEIVDGHFASAADVDRLPNRQRMFSGKQDPVGSVAHIGEIARLRAVAEYDHWPAGQATQQELGNDFTAVAFVMRTWPVGIERADDDCGVTVGPVIGTRVALAG